MRTCRMRTAARPARPPGAWRPPRRRPDVVAMPLGPGAAAEAFAWLNRQLTWQSRLADLEGTLRTRRRRARTS